MLSEKLAEMQIGKMQPPEAPGNTARCPTLKARFLAGVGVLYATADPSVRAPILLTTVGTVPGNGMQPERVQEGIGDVVRGQKGVHEVFEPLPALLVIVDADARGRELILVDVEAGHGAPEVLPPGGQHAGLHHLPGLHVGHDLEEEAVRQHAQPVPVAGQAAAAVVAGIVVVAAPPLAGGFHLAPGQQLRSDLYG